MPRDRISAAAILLISAVSAFGPGAPRAESATVGPLTYRVLERVDQLIRQSAYREALKKLDALLPATAAGSALYAIHPARGITRTRRIARRTKQKGDRCPWVEQPCRPLTNVPMRV